MDESVLNRPTLVLNKGWTPIEALPIRKVMKTVFTGRGVFLDPVDYSQHDIASWIKLPVGADEPGIDLMTRRIRSPEIMLLTDFNRIPTRTVVFCRRNLWRRDRRRCQYCGCEPTGDDITVDHVLPRSKGGESTFENCVLSCTACNLKKGNRLLAQSGMKLQRRKHLSTGEWTTVFYDIPKHPIWNPLYALRRKTFPKSWAAFLRNFDEALYWEVQLET